MKNSVDQISNRIVWRKRESREGDQLEQYNSKKGETKMKDKLNAIAKGSLADLNTIESGIYTQNWPDGALDDNGNACPTRGDAADTKFSNDAVAFGAMAQNPATKLGDLQAAAKSLAARLPDGM